MRYTTLALAFMASFIMNAAEWQWSATIHDYISGETGTNPEAFLWIPPACDKVNAVIIAQQNMSEETLLENVPFRREMEKAGVAFIWITPGIEQKWDPAGDFQKYYDSMLGELAGKSGYEELAFAPVIPLGHSAMATYPWNYAASNPENTLAVISLHGDAPRTNLTGYGRENADWARRDIDGIPGLMIQGQFEWWEARVNPALAFRMVYPQSCISFLMDGGRGHFDVSERTALYIASFISKAIEQRLPSGYDATARPSLIKVDPKEGWLAQRWSAGDGKREKPAPASRYKGDVHDAFWYFDREMAEKTENIYKQIKGKKQQHIGFTINGSRYGFNKESHAGFSVSYDPAEKGMILNMKGIYTDSLRCDAVSKHPDRPVRFEKICGPVRAIDDTTFVIEFFRTGMINPRRAGGIWLAACSDGDKRYNSAVQQIEIKIPVFNKEGEPQSIHFPDVNDIGKETRSITLNATASSGLPVSYYVKEGPAEITDGKLVITEIPRRAKFPFKVTVTAWQYGEKGKFSSAQPVERSFYITQ